MSTKRDCPHGGTLHGDGFQVDCGDDGQLCPMCREDRADARTDRLVEGLALAGILSNPETTRYIDEHGSNVKAMDRDVVSAIGRVTAALREREGGEE